MSHGMPDQENLDKNLTSPYDFTVDEIFLEDTWNNRPESERNKAISRCLKKPGKQVGYPP